MKNYKKVLIISNDACCGSSSNGRTIMNFFWGYPKDKLAQFCIHGTPDETFCESFYRNTDNDALRSFLCKKKIGSQSGANNSNLASSFNNKKIQKNCLNMYIRSIVWNSYRWWDKGFDDFLNRFSPEVIFFQAGDSPFMYGLVRKISKKYGIPIIMFNTESYVLKERIYNGVKKWSLGHILLKNELKRQYKKIMATVDYCIYSMEELEAAYLKKYNYKNKSCTLYTTSELVDLADKHGDIFSLLYCGNLGVGRDKPLSEIAKALYEIDPNAVFDVYGKFTSKESENLVCENKNVVFHGLVDYSQVPELMSKASVVVHCENDDRLENLRYAFSTKIADNLSSGRPFLVYAIREYPFVKYIERNSCAHIASSYEELKLVLNNCMLDEKYRNKYSENAKLVSLKNHNKQSNLQKIIEITGMVSN